MEQHLIACPQCGNRFNIDTAIQNDIKESLQKEFDARAKKQASDHQLKLKELELKEQQLEKLQEQQDSLIKEELAKRLKLAEEKIRKQTVEESSEKLKILEEENTAKAAQLKEARKREAALEQLQRTWNEEKENAEIEMQKKMIEREKVIKEEAIRFANEKAALDLKEKEIAIKKREEELELQAERKANELTEKVKNEESLKRAELVKKLEDQNKLVDEMKRKYEQGSMQLQGEVQELAIEQYLVNAYPQDEINEIKTGARGADVLQIVKSTLGNDCGKIYYESKRTKDFQTAWINKFKEDMRGNGAEIGVLVTEVLPKGQTRFHQCEGIWICTFNEFKAVSLILRESLLKLQQKTSVSENKGEKMSMLYDYLTSNEFRCHIEAIVEGFTCMKDGLEKEKRLMYKTWNEREKQIEKVIVNTVGMYGSIKGIAGGAVKKIKELEMENE